MERISALIPEEISPNVKNFLLITRAWPDIAGINNSKISYPYKMYNKKLVIAVFDNMFIQGLTFIKDELITRLNEKGFNIETIQFKYKPKKVIIKNDKEFKEISEKEKKVIQELVSKIKDEKLKKNFENALKSYFRIHTLKEFLNIE